MYDHARNGLEENLIYLFNKGKYYRAYESLGSHLSEGGGVRFSVWAPDVLSVAVAGDFNGWDQSRNFLEPYGSTGIWTGVIKEACEGCNYKYAITPRSGGTFLKADPFAFEAELRPATASKVHHLYYEWKDGDWIKNRAETSHFAKPKNIYEVHLGSWKQHEPENGEQVFYTYRELTDELIPYMKDMGYNYIELMPVMEHPFDGSWGYQVTGYFAATSRYGSPEDLMGLIDAAHSAGIGVILDWVPAHFCKDAHGLYMFNGGKLFEKKEHTQWGTMVFDYARAEVRSFLISSAIFWLSEFHADAIRVDGVSSMIYLNYGVDDPSQMEFNPDGSQENIPATSFLKELSHAVADCCPGCFTVAEESTAWPLVTYPAEDGGLGFHYKWDMGWMNDTLRYVSTDYLFRKYHHNLITFSMAYSFSENFILPLSHDEVVHGKKSLLDRQQGDYDRMFWGLRLLYLYQMTHPGAKLTFMGSEIAPFIEWRYKEGLQWFLLDYPTHAGVHRFVRDLNRLYLATPALWSDDKSWSGFDWIEPNDAEQSVFSYLRQSAGKHQLCVVVLNFGWNGYGEFRVGVPSPGVYKRLISTQDEAYGGTGAGPDRVAAEKIPCNGRPYSINISLPAGGGAIYKRLTQKHEQTSHRSKK